MIIHKKTRNQKLIAMLRKNLNQRGNLMMIRMILKPVVLPKQNQKLLKKRLPLRIKKKRRMMEMKNGVQNIHQLQNHKHWLLRKPQKKN